MAPVCGSTRQGMPLDVSSSSWSIRVRLNTKLYESTMYAACDSIVTCAARHSRRSRTDARVDKIRRQYIDTRPPTNNRQYSTSLVGRAEPDHRGMPHPHQDAVSKRARETSLPHRWSFWRGCSRLRCRANGPNEHWHTALSHARTSLRIAGLPKHRFDVPKCYLLE